MSYTKLDFVKGALREIGLGSYVFDAQPEELDNIAVTLDGMMAQWDGKSIRLGYPISSSPSAVDIDQDTGVPDWANEGIRLGLAIKIAPSFGKVISQDTKTSFKSAYDAIVKQSMDPVEPRKLPSTMPLGSGNKRSGRGFYNNFVSPSQPTVDAGDDGQIILE